LSARFYVEQCTEYNQTYTLCLDCAVGYTLFENKEEVNP